VSGNAASLAALDAMGLGVLGRAMNDGREGAPAWAAPEALCAAAEEGRTLLLSNDPRFEALLDHYGAHRYGESGGSFRVIARQRRPADELYDLLPLSRRDVLDLIARELKQNRFLRAESFPPSNDDRADFAVVRDEDGFAVCELEDGFPRLSLPEVHPNLPDAWRDLHQLAGWLKDRVDTYRQSALRVAQAIGAEEQEFFAQGPPAIRQLRVGDLARTMTGRGDADVLRHFQRTTPQVVAKKTIETPHGRFPLDAFLAPLTEEDRPIPLRERDRKAMVEDLADVAKMARWAKEQGIARVAIAVRG
jgi:hypothetical protein